MDGGRALVTGASGLLGSALCRALLADGVEVHATSRSPRQDGGDAGVCWHRLDPSDGEAVRALVAEVEPAVIYPLSGSVTGVRDLAEVLPSLRANLVATVAALVAAAEVGGVRVVTAGSMEEPAPPGGLPSSPYAAAKQAAHQYAAMLAAQHGLDWVDLRTFVLYGPGPQPLAKLIPHVIGEALAGRDPVLGSGTRSVDWVYVEDAARAFVLAGRAEVRGTLDIGSGRARPIREMVEMLVDIVGTGVRPRFDAGRDRPDEVVREADLGPAEAALGWRPQTSLEEGLAATVEWYRDKDESGATWKR